MSVPIIITYGQIVHNVTINITEKDCDFLDKAIRNYLNQSSIDKIEEIEIVFISDLKDMTYTHYIKQPKSMICRNMIRTIIEVKGEDINDFEYIWLPGCLCVID